PVSVDVQAGGEALALVRVLRGGAPRPSRQGVVAFVEWDEDGRHQTVAATGVVDVDKDPAVLPRAHAWLAGGAVLLLAAAGVAELLRLRVRRSAGDVQV